MSINHSIQSLPTSPIGELDGIGSFQAVSTLRKNPGTTFSHPSVVKMKMQEFEGIFPAID